MAAFFSQLNDRLQNFTPSVKEIFLRIFRVQVGYGEIRPPGAMLPWIQKQFGDLGNIKKQEIVRIDNLITGEGTLFNVLRDKRPRVEEERFNLEELIKKSCGDSFCRPKEQTPEDVFGRIEGKHCITAANVAKYDKWHGVIIFNEHHPLKFDEEKIKDYLEVADEWYKKVNSLDGKAIYPIFMWNCLWRASASIIHGHAQVLLGRDKHYVQVENLRRLSYDYYTKYGSNYFADLFAIHKGLGLAKELYGMGVLSYLTPIKNKNVIILAKKDPSSLAKVLNKILKVFTEKLNVLSFNLVILYPPLKKIEENWQHFPVIVRLIDRGDLSKKTSDIGGGELFYQSVAEEDPYKVASSLNF